MLAEEPDQAASQEPIEDTVYRHMEQVRKRNVRGHSVPRPRRFFRENVPDRNSLPF
jgi:hypothetical protein